MTYPPQPPGPPQGPYGPPPPGPQDPYNQGPYPYQQPQWGYPPGPPPKKSRAGLIATLIVVAFVVVGGVAAYVLLGRGDDPGKGSGQGGGDDGGARGAAQTYVQALETALNTPAERIDLSKLEPVTCDEDFARMKDEFVGGAKGDGPGADSKIRIRMKDFERTADGATFTLTRRVTGGGGEPDSRDMTVARDGDAWKVCGLFGRPGGGEGDDDEDTDSPSPSRELPPNPIPTT